MNMLSYLDFIGGALCLILLYIFLAIRTKRFDSETRRLFRTAFNLRVFCVIIFSLITAYYYKGGDTEMFLYATRDIHNAWKNDDISLLDLLFTSSGKDANATLTYYFELDNTRYPVGGFMKDAGNFMVPKLGFLPYILFFNSYVAMCMVFSFFALEGCIRLYQLMLKYFPTLRYELAFAIMFLPSVCYWSSGFLKDSICFGSAGFILYGLYNVFIAKRKIIGSLIALIIGTYFMYTIKVYILLAFIPAIAFWIFGEIRNVTRNKNMRRLITVFSLVLAIAAGGYMINYLTSSEALAKFSLDNIMETSSSARDMYESQSSRREGAYFTIETTSPVLLPFSGLVATFFRPFLWEASSAIVLLSSIEAMFFLFLLVFLIMKKGVFAPIRVVFEHPILLLCFTFSMIFSVSVGISATNFGSLSRYKIPCLPFYLMFVLISYNLLGVKYPKWFMSVLSVIKKRR